MVCIIQMQETKVSGMIFFTSTTRKWEGLCDLPKGSKKMKITNNYNIPESIYQALKDEIEPSIEKLHITTLINPPYMHYLKIRHWNEIEEDASERLWALLGTAVHYVLEKYSPENSVAENRIEIKRDGFILTGKSDLYHNGVISDYKVTSVWSFLYGDKKDWEQQLNCYAWLYRETGLEVKDIEINAILRDWQKSRVNYDYPPIPFLRKKIRLWSKQEQDEYISNRLNLYNHIKSSLQFNEPPILDDCFCSEEERWARVDKKGIKTYIRCQDYCPVRSFCERREN